MGTGADEGNRGAIAAQEPEKHAEGSRKGGYSGLRPIGCYLGRPLTGMAQDIASPSDSSNRAPPWRNISRH